MTAVMQEQGGHPGDPEGSGRELACRSAAHQLNREEDPRIHGKEAPSSSRGEEGEHKLVR